MSTVPYTFQIRKFNQFGADYEYAVLRTDLSRVKPEIINAQMKTKPHIGVNGGFFHSTDDYKSPPAGLRAISWWKGDSNSYRYNGTATNQLSRKTFVAYRDSSNLIRGTHMYAKNLDEVLANYPTATAVIGGNDYNDWGLDGTFATWRTAFVWDNSYRYGYMIVTQNKTVNIGTLKTHIEAMGFDPVNSIVLDGSGSSTMRVVENGAVKLYSSQKDHVRYIGNMIRVFGYDYYG
ncbi:phosphodiester glycosidase family protein [Paenibacillus sp. FSL K6-2862]|uniref:phosphodiester glycosidase family protein n=1 Tax=Paenibacillus sp. FSL K6-2862 TaxID=2921484 RepID=UPI0030FA6920